MKRAVEILRQPGPARRELASAALLSASLFLILAGYYLLKTVREALILTSGGAEVKSYAAGGQALILLTLLPLLGWIANRVKGARLVSGVYLFFATNLLAFHAMGNTGAGVAVAFYLWLGVFSVVSLALFWGFSNDLYTQSQGQRLFPFIGVGASVGGFLGAGIAKKLAAAFQPDTAMLAGAALVAGSAGLLVAARRYANPKPVVVVAAAAPSKGGFQLIASSRYLALIAAMVVLTNVVNSTGEYIVGRSVVEASKALVPALQKQYIAGFYADYYMLTGLAGVLIQVLAVAPVFRRFGAGGALLILPVVAVSGYAAMAVLPAMWVIRSAKIAENSLDYSMQNTAKHALFLPTTEAAKYKAKATIDAFFYRFGDMLQAGLVLVGSWLSLSAADYARFNIVAALLWLGVAVAAGREYRRRTQPRSETTRTLAPMRAAA